MKQEREQDPLKDKLQGTASGPHNASPALRTAGCGLARGRGSRGLSVSGNCAYAADSNGLAVIAVSQPPHCVRAGGYDTAGYAYGVAVSPPYACVADGDGGLQVVDVSDPAHCVR